MSRTTVEIPINTDYIDDVLYVIDDILKKNKYSEKLLDGEVVWLKGDGVKQALQCFTVAFTGHSVQIQGWITGMWSQETKIDGGGIWGYFPRKTMLPIMEKLYSTIASQGY